MDHELPITRYKRRNATLNNERETWLQDYKEISKYLLPRSGRYLSSDRNKGGSRNRNILDSTATGALDILGAGLMSGMTSPARPWFRLGIPDDDLEQYDPVKQWLFKSSKVMREIFSRSNTYRSLHTMYEELGAFGTAASFVQSDFNDVIRFYPLTAGEYAISTDYRGVVDTCYREIPMTVAQMVQKFGLENVSQNVKNQYDRKNYDAWITVMHAVEPRAENEREYGKKDGKNKRFKSCYFEAAGDAQKPLSEGGFDEFPLLVPRWSVRSGDIYGHSPGMRALGDVIQLQHEQLRKGEAIDYQTKPPLQAPIAMKDKPNDLLPGGLTYVDMVGPQNGIRSAFDVQLNLSYLLEDINDVRGRTREAFYADLFMMLANDNRSGITATEIAERHEEKLLMLGPVLERLHNEMLSPLIDMTFQHMLEADLVPPPPPELEGMNLKVEFVSTLAQAQRAVGLGSLDRLLMTVGNLAAAKQDPSVWDKLDTDQIIDGYGEMMGVDPQFIVADDRVTEIRTARAQQQAQQQAMAQAAEMAKTAGSLAGIPSGEDNALSDVMRQFSGYSSASPA